MSYYWNQTTSNWMLPPTLSSYTYNSRAQVQQVVDTDSATTQPKSRSSYSYTASGPLTSYTRERWTGTSWENIYRETYLYDNTGNYNEVSSQNWVNGAWQNQLRTIHTYDTHHNYTGSTHQSWVNNMWATDGIARYTYTYNAAGAITEEVQQYWDANANALMIAGRYIYTVTGTQPWSERVYQRWTNGAYVNERRRINPQRDASGSEIGYVEQIWDGTNWGLKFRASTTFPNPYSSQLLSEEYVQGSWVNDGRFSLNNDAYGNYLGSVSEQWINNTWSIVNANRALLSYNAANNVTRRVQQDYDRTTQAYISRILTTYGDYQTITLANKQALALMAVAEVFPNPTPSKVTLKLAGLPKQESPLRAQVLNSVGQVVKQFTLKSQQGVVEQELTLEYLKAGVYTLHVLTSEGTVVKRIVRQ